MLFSFSQLSLIKTVHQKGIKRAFGQLYVSDYSQQQEEKTMNCKSSSARSYSCDALILFVKHSGMTLSFSNGLSFEKGLGLLITPLCLFAFSNLITVALAPLSLPFFVIFGGILTSLKASITLS